MKAHVLHLADGLAAEASPPVGPQRQREPEEPPPELLPKTAQASGSRNCRQAGGMRRQQMATCAKAHEARGPQSGQRGRGRKRNAHNRMNARLAEEAKAPTPTPLISRFL
jgi:hypothetical protein